VEAVVRSALRSPMRLVAHARGWSRKRIRKALSERLQAAHMRMRGRRERSNLKRQLDAAVAQFRRHSRRRRRKRRRAPRIAPLFTSAQLRKKLSVLERRLKKKIQAGALGMRVAKRLWREWLSRRVIAAAQPPSGWKELAELAEQVTSVSLCVSNVGAPSNIPLLPAQAWAAGLLLLQEVKRGTRSECGLPWGWNIVSTPRSEGAGAGGGTGIAWDQRRFQVVPVPILCHAAAGRQDRGGEWTGGLVTTTRGAPLLLVVSCYFSHGATQAALRHLLRGLKISRWRGPTLLGGDFNVASGTARGAKLLDILQENGGRLLNDAGLATLFPYSGGRPKCVDWALGFKLGSAQLRLVDAHRDHKVLELTVKIGAKRPPAHLGRFCCQKLQQQNRWRIWKEWMHDQPISGQGWDDLFAHLVNAADRAIGRHTPTRESTYENSPFWSPHLQALKRRVRRGLVKGDRSGVQLFKIRLSASKDKFFRKLLTAKPQEILSTLFRRSKSRVPRFFENPHRTLRLWRGIFGHGLPLPVTPSLNQLSIGERNAVPAVTSQEIGHILWHLKTRKSAHDREGITFGLVRMASVQWTEVLASLMTAILRNEVRIPPLWKSARVVLIPKRGSDGHRPISILSSFGKLLEAVVAGRLWPRVGADRPAMPQQFGFRSGRSAIDACWLIAVRDQRADAPLFTVTLDMKKAFDSCPWEGVLQNLPGHGYPRWFCILMQDWLSGHVRYLDVPGVQDSPIKVSRGVPQGGVLSPTLFNVWLDSLIFLVNSRQPDVEVIAYADDVTLVSRSLPALQSALDVAWAWAGEHKVVWNPGKSFATTLGKGRRRFQVTLGGVALEWKRQVTILGNTFSASRHAPYLAASREAMARETLQRLSRSLTPAAGCPPRASGIVMSQVLLAQLLYGCEIFPVRKSSEQVWNVAARVILGAFKSDSASRMRHFLGWRTVADYVEIRRRRFVKHLLSHKVREVRDLAKIVLDENMIHWAKMVSERKEERLVAPRRHPAMEGFVVRSWVAYAFSKPCFNPRDVCGAGSCCCRCHFCGIGGGDCGAHLVMCPKVEVGNGRFILALAIASRESPLWKTRRKWVISNLYALWRSRVALHRQLGSESDQALSTPPSSPINPVDEPIPSGSATESSDWEMDDEEEDEEEKMYER